MAKYGRLTDLGRYLGDISVSGKIPDLGRCLGSSFTHGDVLYTYLTKGDVWATPPLMVASDRHLELRAMTGLQLHSWQSMGSSHN
jgi:hypothetical protein